MTGDYTGWCDEQIGYQVYSVFQPLWELMHGMSCTPDPPFGCATVPGLPDLKDPVLEAVLYSVRMAPMTYQQLIDGISTRVACEYAGPDNPEIWEAYRSIVCHHGWIACDADPPTNCSTCGNNVRETGEQCDGGDFSGPTCADLEMSGELVGCDEDCHIVCVDAGTDSTAGSGGDGTATSIGSSSDTTIAPTSDTGGDGGGGGCGCRRAAGAPGALVLVLLWALRRRRWCEF
jgi:hypothetical protein